MARQVRSSESSERTPSHGHAPGLIDAKDAGYLHMGVTERKTEIADIEGGSS